MMNPKSTKPFLSFLGEIWSNVIELQPLITFENAGETNLSATIT